MTASGSDRAGILFLGHCAGPFLEVLAAAAREHGLASFVLTSRALGDPVARLGQLNAIAAWVRCTDAFDLTSDDVTDALLDLTSKGFTVRGCLTVWEGYRVHMAMANGMLGVADLDPDNVTRLLDKLFVRRHLAAAGLSRGAAEIVTEENLDQLKRSGRKLFIKPIRGIASYGAFMLNEKTSWQTMQNIAVNAQSDVMFSGLLGGTTFLAEDFIEGHECSFEIIVIRGEVFVIAMHEKLRLTQTSTTVLEDIDVSPPLNVSTSGIASGIDWVRNVLASFDVKWGCHHIEARYDGLRWDLIEINPRMGGRLVSASVGRITHGSTLIQLLLAALIAPDIMRSKIASLAIDADGQYRSVEGTMFRTYYAAPGRIVNIKVSDVAHPPTLMVLYASAGDVIPDTDREFGIAELLWAFDLAERPSLLPLILADSDDVLQIEYESKTLG